ncbi:MAG: hypothetical protein RR140_02015 [Clostridia bacterium]
MQFNDFQTTTNNIEEMAKEYSKALQKQGFVFVRLNAQPPNLINFQLILNDVEFLTTSYFNLCTRYPKNQPLHIAHKRCVATSIELDFMLTQIKEVNKTEELKNKLKYENVKQKCNKNNFQVQKSTYILKNAIIMQLSIATKLLEIQPDNKDELCKIKKAISNLLENVKSTLYLR